MSNPKVFEYAKEVGLTPLALMDKIREWQLPVKSHMAELEPDVLAQIKIKLSGGKQVEEAKPKKVVAKKAPAKKPAAEVEKTDPAAAAAAVAAASSKTVVRRKAVEPELKTKIISKPAVEAAPVEVSSEASENAAEVVKPALKKAEPAAETTAEVVAKAEVPAVDATRVEPAKKVEVTKPAEAVTTPAAPVTAATTADEGPKVAVASRKKEVIVGNSGVSSNAAPVSAPKRNIVGRMDLSRVTPPPRPQGGFSGGGDRPSYGDRNQQGGAGSGFGARPGGFSGPRTQKSNIRAGFVAAPALTPAEMLEGEERKREFDKRKKFGGGPATAAAVTPAAKEREEEVQVFNAVEFRKREMVFQPKKKKSAMDRTALKTQITTPSARKRVLKVNGSMKVTDVAVELGLKAPQLMKSLMMNGVSATLNTDLDFDTIALIVPEFGWEAQNVLKSAEEIAEATAFGDLEAERITRPPVVTVMGHVDHGKTSLLDAIRQANVAAKEAGGITQHIGAYSVKLEDGYEITFLDTPGHEAFTAMRARGANATDIAVIVVAADDGMMPQTQEAINHAKAANVPIIVAVNKMDKPGANPDRIKQQLTELQIVPEEWGGSTIFAEVSALKKTGVKELLENIKLLAEMQDLKANPKRSGTGVVIEAKLEKGKGPVATLLVKDGFIKVGQYIVAGTVKGRIRSLMNDKGQRVDEVLPGYPVEVQGLEETPGAGDRFDIVKDESAAEDVARTRKEKAMAALVPHKLSLDEIFSKVKSGDVKELAIVLKADVQGSLEAVIGMIGKLSTPEVKAKIIHTGVGGITESDVLLANTAKGVVIGFNVRPDSGAAARAKNLGVDIRSYSIVYELIDEMKKAMGGMLSPDVVEEVLGHVEVRNTFTVPKIGTIAGCFVIDGKVQRNNMIRLVRDGKIVFEGKISSLKRFKDDAKEVATGYECGIGIENFNDVKVGDKMEAYVKKEIARELDGSSAQV